MSRGCPEDGNSPTCRSELARGQLTRRNPDTVGWIQKRSEQSAGDTTDAKPVHGFANAPYDRHSAIPPLFAVRRSPLRPSAIRRSVGPKSHPLREQARSYEKARTAALTCRSELARDRITRRNANTVGRIQERSEQSAGDTTDAKPMHGFANAPYDRRFVVPPLFAVRHCALPPFAVPSVEIPPASRASSLLRKSPNRGAYL